MKRLSAEWLALIALVTGAALVLLSAYSLIELWAFP